VAIVKGKDKVNLQKISNLLRSNPKIATPEDIRKYTGYSVGGVPSFGFRARFLIDERIMEKTYVITGGGSDRFLVKISPIELQKSNGGIIVDIAK